MGSQLELQLLQPANSQGFVASLSLNPKTLKATKPLPYSGAPVTMGDHLKKRRLKLGLCQPGLAKQLGVSEWTLRHWETNATVPAIRIVPRIIEFLGYDPNPEPSDLRNASSGPEGGKASRSAGSRSSWA